MLLASRNELASVPAVSTAARLATIITCSIFLSYWNHELAFVYGNSAFNLHTKDVSWLYTPIFKTVASSGGFNGACTLSTLKI